MRLPSQPKWLLSSGVPHRWAPSATPAKIIRTGAVIPWNALAILARTWGARIHGRLGSHTVECRVGLHYNAYRGA